MSDEAETLWRTVDNALRDMRTADREFARKLLIRRLKHFGVAGGHPESVPLEYIHKTQDGGPMPRFDSPLCWCGATRAQHAEDGSYDPNGCPMYVSAR